MAHRHVYVPSIFLSNKYCNKLTYVCLKNVYYKFYVILEAPVIY